MTKKELDKKQHFKAYILKDIFLHDLKMHEIRLCIFLTSNKKRLKDMNCEEKMWCSGGVARNYSLLKESELKLINLGLINTDGTGLSIKENEFIQSNKLDFYHCKTQRELFVNCLKYWYKYGKFTSIRKEYIVSIFGKEKKYINRNVKRTIEQTGIQFTLQERVNDYLVVFPKSTKPKSAQPYIPYNEYLQTEHWKTISKEYKDKYGKCQLCGSTKGLNVHHNNYDCLFHETDKDLIVLCSECHKKFHDIS